MAILGIDVGGTFTDAVLLDGDEVRTAKAGAAGGEPGEPGRNLLNGDELAPFVSRDLATGDVLRVETPGGGGYGMA